MPKLKTHKGASKRFKKNGNRQSGSPPCFCGSSHSDLEVSARKRKLGKSVVADDTNQAELRRMIPY